MSFPARGAEVVVKVHTHVREDVLILFGFITQREKDLFLRLISISGIGPKLAITILSGARVEELASWSRTRTSPTHLDSRSRL